jgi:sigma-E factor negative regulatory protein RseC
MIGKIRSVSGKMVVIEPDRPAGCFGCMRQDCAKGLAPITAENRDNLDLAPGLLVETGSSSRTLLQQCAAALSPPLLGFAAGFLLSGIIFPQSGDALRAACGALLLFAAALGFYFFRRQYPPKNIPRILRVIS